jgi:hypothetical protein
MPPADIPLPPKTSLTMIASIALANCLLGVLVYIALGIASDVSKTQEAIARMEVHQARLEMRIEQLERQLR